MMTLVAVLVMASQASAMSYEQARREALFLTDKMAYELNLTQEQYEAAYEINLDYLMGVTSVDDVYSICWTRRNLDLSYILLDWQWSAFRAASYFYRPLYWDAGYWHFGVYARYPHRTFHYFARPAVYLSYRGGHSWRSNGGRSYYHNRRDDFRRPDSHVGLRDRWDKGDFRNARTNGRSSSTRVTANRSNTPAGNSSTPATNRTGSRFGGARTGSSAGQPSGIRVPGGKSGATTSSSVRTQEQKTAGTTAGRQTGSVRFGTANGFGGQRNSSALGTSRTTFGTSKVNYGTSNVKAVSPSRSTFSAPKASVGTSSRSSSFGQSHSSGSPTRVSTGASRSGGSAGGPSSRGGSFGGRR